MTDKSKSANQAGWSPETLLVHGGTLRSQFGETSEAMFLTQSFVYDSAEQAEARFKGDEEGYVYSRYANPTVSMFEERMCLLEGAEARRARRTRPHGTEEDADLRRPRKLEPGDAARPRRRASLAVR